MAKQSSQKFIARNRAPRVQIEYEVEVYGAQKNVQVPFVMGVLADLACKQDELPNLLERNMLEIDVDNFDARMKALKPRAAFTVPNTLTGEGHLKVDITFESMDDFSPAAVARKVAGLDKLLEVRTQLANLVTYMDGKVGAEELITRILQDKKLLRELVSKSNESADEETTRGIRKVSEGYAPSRVRSEYSIEVIEFPELLKMEFKPKSDRAAQAVESAVQTLAQQVLVNEELLVEDTVSSIDAIIAEIDLKLTQQINHVLHHPEFQQLEGAWRGLHHLVYNSETDEMLKIRFMSVSKHEFGKIIKAYKGTAWDQSPLFKKLCEEEFGKFGGEPYGCLIGDYYFDQSPTDVEILSGMARIAAAANAPFLAGAAPSIMQMGTWQELPNPRDLTKILATPEYAAWRSLRESEDSRYLGLAVPRFLARLPYGGETDPVEEFCFEEDTDGADSSRYTWINSAYAMGVNINRAFKNYGWCARIRGVESGGAVEFLTLHVFPADDGGVAIRCPTEIAISDRREAELSKCGFMPLMHKKNSDLTVFISAQSLQHPPEYDDPDATANAVLTARLPYLFAGCRFVHYMKCIVRDRIGSFTGRAEMEKWLNEWILQYVDDEPSHSNEIVKARKPLGGAEIALMEMEGNPGYYVAHLYIRPHYQLEGLTVTFRLVTLLPAEHSA